MLRDETRSQTEPQQLYHSLRIHTGKLGSFLTLGYSIRVAARLLHNHWHTANSGIHAYWLVLKCHATSTDSIHGINIPE